MKDKDKRQAKFDIELLAYETIHEALTKYRDYEIGGMLIGYQKSRNHFSISGATVADDVGRFSIGSFIREPMKSFKALVRSFKKRKHCYIGEWHSHPRFKLFPSSEDIATMYGILSDPGYGVNFALLVTTKLRRGKVAMAGFLFHKRLPRFVEATIIEDFLGHG